MDKFGKYLLLDKIATGGMAEIWLAKQTGLEGFEKLVVIKKILPHFISDIEFINMFLDEARLAAKLNHQNIVQIYDLGKEDNTYYIAMEYIFGEDLKSIAMTAIAAGTFIPIHLSCAIVSQIAQGLSYAHKLKDLRGNALNLVHRDISPQNIIVTYEGNVKIVDFGIAKAATSSNSTKTGTLKGKFAYMSPEQAKGESTIDSRSDIFALGILLFELTTGQRLFKCDTELATLKKITEEPIVSPLEMKSDYPFQLCNIVLKALEKDKEKRYQNIQEMQKDLDSFLKKYPKPSSNIDISNWMQQIFKTKIENGKRRNEQLVNLDEKTENAFDFFPKNNEIKNEINNELQYENDSKNNNLALDTTRTDSKKKSIIENVPIKEEKKKSNKKIIAISTGIVIALIVLFFVAFGFFVTSKKSSFIKEFTENISKLDGTKTNDEIKINIFSFCRKYDNVSCDLDSLVINKTSDKVSVFMKYTIKIKYIFIETETQSEINIK